MKPKLSWQNAPLAIEGLRILRADGRTLAAARDGEYMGSDPCWSPDRKWLAYSGYDAIPADQTMPSNDSPGIWRVNADLQNARQLTAGWDTAPAIASDGKRLVFVRQFPPGAEATDSRTRIYLLDIPSGRVSPLSGLTAAERHSDEAPSWSPDGRQIVFVSNRTERKRLWVATVPGEGGRSSSPAHPLDYLPKGDFLYPAWSPVNHDTVVCVSDKLPEALYLIHLERRSVRCLPIPGLVPAHVAWSPDGSHLAFLRSTGVRSVALFIARVDGSGMRQCWPRTKVGGKSGFSVAW